MRCPASSKHSLTGIAALVGLSLLVGSTARAQVTTRYTITDLGVAAGTSASIAYGLNDNGIAVGISDYHAVRFNGKGTVLDFGVLDGQAIIYGINNSGVMIGSTQTVSFLDSQFQGSRALRFNANGTVTPLSTKNSQDLTVASAINEANVIVGGHNSVVARFSPDGKTVTDIAPTSESSVANGISANGRVAGTFGFRAALFSATAAAPNLTLLPMFPNEVNACANGVNSAGDAVGYSNYGSPLAWHAMRWKHGASSPIRLAPAFSYASSLAENGMAVGGIFGRAVIWNPDNTIIDLATVLDKSGTGWKLREARAINRKGQIVGFGWHNGQQRAFLLTPNLKAPLPTVRVAVTLSRDEVLSGEAVTGTVQLTSPAPSGGATVTLTSTQPQEVWVPSQVKIPAGKTTATFPVGSVASSLNWETIIQASSGESQANAFLSLAPSLPDLHLVDMNIAPSTLVGGVASTGSITLDASAALGPIVIPLVSDRPQIVKVPASVTVAAGQINGVFSITTSAVTVATPVTISAIYNNTEVFAVMMINPAPASDIVAISQADYATAKKQLTVSATSTNANATLKVYVTSTNALIGTLTNKGGGKYSATFSNLANPQNITVKSSAGGSASKAVTLK